MIRTHHRCAMECLGGAQRTAQGGRLMSQDKVELVRSAYEAYNRRDVEGVLGRFDQDIDWHVPDSLAWGDHVRGLEAVGRFFDGLKPYMGDDHRVEIGELIDA